METVAGVSVGAGIAVGTGVGERVGAGEAVGGESVIAGSFEGVVCGLDVQAANSKPNSSRQVILVLYFTKSTPHF